MIKLLLIMAALSLISISAASQKYKSESQIVSEGITGKLIRYIDFKSNMVDSHTIDVWLPTGYDSNSPERYPVIYMPDGQNVFDPKTSFIGVDWGVDEAMTKLISEKKVKPAIVVAVWNNGSKRWIEYIPQKSIGFVKDSTVLTALNKRIGGRSESDNYLKFIVSELKPFIDSTYKTLTTRENTFLLGSSTGGLFSVYAICEYPEIFGRAACLSTNWLAGNGMVLDYLNGKLPDSETHRIYFDYGTVTLDEQFLPYQKRVNELFISNGWTENKNWVNRKFEGEEHSERAWKKRIDIPLVFLLGN